MLELGGGDTDLSPIAACDLSKYVNYRPYLFVFATVNGGDSIKRMKCL